MAIRFRTQTACKIARIDRNRFNEAVAADNYRCAPSTEPGLSRLFAENDLIALFIYGHLLSSQPPFPPKLAGDFACRVLQVLEQSPDATTVSYESSFAGVNATVADAKPLPQTIAGDNPIIIRLQFDVAEIRNFILREMKEEASILGDDE